MFTKKQNAAVAGCAGKPRYETYLIANDHARRVHGHSRLNPYHCAHCHGYHIGGRGVRKIVRPRPALDDDDYALGYGDD